MAQRRQAGAIIPAAPVPRRALVIDRANSRAALAGVRALGAAGWHVGVASPVENPLAGASRAARSLHSLPAPDHDLDGFLAGVAAAVEAGGYGVVFPTDDPQLLALSAHRDRVGARVPYPSHEVLERSLDKLHLAEAAREAGFGAVRTVEATPEAIAAWEGPAVVKPRLHNPLTRAGAPAHFDTKVVRTRAEAAAAADAIARWGAAPLLQDLVEGEQVALGFVAREGGACVAAIQQVVVRMMPPGAGISTRAETTAVDPELEAAASRLIAGLGWWGLVQLQFRTRGDGLPVLIDFNPRFYGSLALAEHAGVNLPAAWAALICGEASTPSRGRPGRRYQWLEGDVRATLATGGAGRPWRLAGVVAYALRAGHTAWRRDDPRPALRVAARTARRARRRLVRALRTRR